jgi:hypothetical protein
LNPLAERACFSQVEFVYSPLCCIEMVKGGSPVAVGGVLRFAMVFTQNATTCEPQSAEVVKRWQSAPRRVLEPITITVLETGPVGIHFA